MPYDPRAVANYFLDRAEAEGKHLDLQKLLKLLYIAHGWHLAIAGEALLSRAVEAWEYGPVVPEVYDEFLRFGDRVIRDRAAFPDFETDYLHPYALEDYAYSDEELAETRTILDRVWESHKNFTGRQLSTMTRQPGSPWAEIAAKQQGKPFQNRPMLDGPIRRYYTALAHQNRAARQRATEPADA